MTPRALTAVAVCAALAAPARASAQQTGMTLDELARLADRTTRLSPSTATARRRPWAVELGGFGGAAASLHAGTGYVAGLEALVRLDWARGALAVGARVAWSEQGVHVLADLPCRPSASGGAGLREAPASPCLSLAPGGRFELTFTRRFVRVGVPVSWRFGASTRRVQLYVTVAPEVVIETREADPSAAWLPASPPPPTPPPPADSPPPSTAPPRPAVVPDDPEDIRLAVQALVGLRVRFGPGAAFVEVAYALSTTRPLLGDVSAAHTLAAQAGYRFELTP